MPIYMMVDIFPSILYHKLNPYCNANHAGHQKDDGERAEDPSC